MNGSTAYATSDDFCRIFSQEMNSLYLLGFLLTADARKAEQCFVAGIGESVQGNAVFRDWARSWARRTIIQQAIRIMEPARGKLSLPAIGQMTLQLEPRLKAILNLNALERFVFVMSALEGYSDQDCSVLLGCSRQIVVSARSRAVEHLASADQILVQEKGLQSTYPPASNPAKLRFAIS